MSKKYTYEDIKEIVEKEGDKLISTYDEYKGNKSILKIECKCGRASFYRRLSSIKQNHAYHCQKCINENLSKIKKGKSVKLEKMSYEDVKEYVKLKGCEFLSDKYNVASDTYLFKCSCGNIFERTFHKFKDSNQTVCNKCSKKRMKSKLKLNYKDVKRYIESKGCKLLSKEYINNETKLHIQCSCGTEFYRDFTHYKDDKSYYCNKCAKLVSKGEGAIIDLLDKWNIKYEFQRTFNDCRFKGVLPFDFYLPEYNICIEYDGRQHYQFIGTFGDLDEFIDRKIRDTVKNIYCKNNNIKLIRIPYWEIDNIKHILKFELNK